MAIEHDFYLDRFADGVISFELAPPTNIGGWNIVFDVRKRPGSVSGIIVKSCASGFAGSGNASGITVTGSAEGRVEITINSQDTSGLAGNYAFTVERRDSGYHTVLSRGHIILGQSIGQV